jgi:hypothetical protein
MGKVTVAGTPSSSGTSTPGGVAYATSSLGFL